jgi:hypothetical protein
MRFWWKNGDRFAAVRNLPLHIGTIRIATRDADFATMRVGTTGAEPQLLGYLRVAGVWQVVVGPGDWSGVCTSPSPQPFTDLFCRP